MSVKLDPKEVLDYLNELGYYNISAQQLKEFMKDLKKLMKYDYEKADKENVANMKEPEAGATRDYYRTPCSQLDYDCAKQFSAGRSAVTCSDTNYRCAERPYVSQPVDVIFSNLHSASTVSSRARSAAWPPNIPGVSFGAAKLDEPSEGSRLTGYYTDCTDYSRAQSALSNRRLRSAETNVHRPKSFIRPARPRPLHPSKSDPVTLYHQYQAEWKKQKLPGEDNRNDLRWAIRERMLSAPSIPPVSTTSASSRTFKTFKRL